MTSIDQGERDASAFDVIRRIRLAQLRQNRENCMTVLNSRPGRSQPLSHRSSIVLDTMTNEWMAESREVIGNKRNEEWIRRRTRLKNRLITARLWHRIFSTYSIGGLALFTTEICTSTYAPLFWRTGSY